MSAVFSAIAAFLGSIPVLGRLVEQFIAWYVNKQIDKMSAENATVIRKAIEEKDQRDIERTMGSSKAGKPSGIDGTTVVDSLPGVPGSGLPSS